MLDIPIGKALIAVEADNIICAGCIFNADDENCPYSLACEIADRADGKSVIFKLVDMPKEATHD